MMEDGLAFYFFKQTDLVEHVASVELYVIEACVIQNILPFPGTYVGNRQCSQRKAEIQSLGRGVGRTTA